VRTDRHGGAGMGRHFRGGDVPMFVGFGGGSDLTFYRIAHAFQTVKPSIK